MYVIHIYYITKYIYTHIYIYKIYNTELSSVHSHKVFGETVYIFLARSLVSKAIYKVI